MRVPFYVTRNVTVPLEPSDEALQLIAALESYDQKLYGFAERLFADRAAAQKPSFYCEVAIFNAIRPLSRVAGSGRKWPSRSLTHSDSKGLSWTRFKIAVVQLHRRFGRRRRPDVDERVSRSPATWGGPTRTNS